MNDEREWPTLTRKIEPLPGGLADLRQRIAVAETPRRGFGKMAFAAAAVACVVAMLLSRGTPHTLFAPSESPRMADARVPTSERVVFYWVGSAPAAETHAVDPESLMRTE